MCMGVRKHWLVHYFWNLGVVDISREAHILGVGGSALTMWVSQLTMFTTFKIWCKLFLHPHTHKNEILKNVEWGQINLIMWPIASWELHLWGSSLFSCYLKLEIHPIYVLQAVKASPSHLAKAAQMASW